MMKMISKIEMTMTPTTRVASTTTESYGNTRIVIKPIITVMMTMMVIHNVFIVKNENTIPISIADIASVNVIIKLEKNINHPKKRNIIVAMTVIIVMIVKNLIHHPMMIVDINRPIIMMMMTKAMSMATV